MENIGDWECDLGCIPGTEKDMFSLWWNQRLISQMVDGLAVQWEICNAFMRTWREIFMNTISSDKK